MTWKSFAVPVRATAGSFAVVLLAFWLAEFVPARWDGNWTAHIVRLQPHVVDRFFPFDGAWYERIATEGYHWDPTQPSVKQDVAFFPLWPGLLRLVAWCMPWPEAARWSVVLVTGCIGFASVCAVHQLAREALSARAAAAATWLYALFPAANFLLLSYPTGLMNLLCALALLAVLRRRFWVAAVCAGLVTAGGPLGLGTAMAVWVSAVAERGRSRVHVLALGVVSISGLFGFMLWQAAAFGDPFAFMKAQEAWAPTMHWLARVPRTLLQLTILPDFGMGFAFAVHAFHARSLVAFQIGWEKALNIAAEGWALLMVVVCVRCAPRPVVLQGVFTLVLFVWFQGSFWPGHATMRLTYCALTTFLGAAWLLSGKPRLMGYIFYVSAFMLFSAAFLVACGYHVV